MNRGLTVAALALGCACAVAVPGTAAAWELPSPTVSNTPTSSGNYRVSVAPVTGLPLFRSASFGDFTYEIRRGSTTIHRVLGSEYSDAFTKDLAPGSYSLKATVTAGFSPVILGKDLMWNNVPEQVWTCSFQETQKTPVYFSGTLAYYVDVQGIASCTDPEGTGRVYRGKILDGFITTSAYSLGYTNSWTQGAVSSEDPQMTLFGPSTWKQSKTVPFTVVGSPQPKPKPTVTQPKPKPTVTKACKRAKKALRHAKAGTEKRQAKKRVERVCSR